MLELHIQKVQFFKIQKYELFWWYYTVTCNEGEYVTKKQLEVISQNQTDEEELRTCNLCVSEHELLKLDVMTRMPRLAALALAALAAKNLPKRGKLQMGTICESCRSRKFWKLNCWYILTKQHVDKAENKQSPEQRHRLRDASWRICHGLLWDNDSRFSNGLVSRARSKL